LFKQCIAEFVIEKKLVAMNKKQLVKRLSQKTGLTLAQSNDFLNSVLEIVTDTLKKKEDVFLRGFGSFMVKDRKERRTMSLNTREMITIPGKKVVKFRTQVLD
jgi:DNA-binding protein HU-beta